MIKYEFNTTNDKRNFLQSNTKWSLCFGVKWNRSSRTLPIIIGAFEAQSIAIALETEIRPPRPLTHDLFKTFSDTFKINIKEVIIHKLVDGVFFSSLVCEREGVEEVIDTRTSDAIAIAVRFNAPIYTYENILDKAGIYLKVEEELAIEQKNRSRKYFSWVRGSRQTKKVWFF